MEEDSFQGGSTDEDQNEEEVSVDQLVQVPVIHISSDNKDKSRVEYIQLENNQILKYSDTVITITDGAQWFNVPVSEVNIDNDCELKTELVEINDDDNEDVVEESFESTDAVVVDDDGNSSSQQIYLLEDGRIAFMQQYINEESNEADEKSEELMFEIPKVNKISKKKERIHICKVPGCLRSYSSLHHLKVHSRNHTGDRPYKCPMGDCSKAFATDYSRKAHLRTHTGEKPYSCPTCMKSFKTSGDLQKHIRIHTGERPFTCSVKGCNRSFTTSNIRKVHIRTHTGEKPYVCTHESCSRSFASSTNFKNHMRIHSGEKPYCCPIPSCMKRFTEYSSLYKHQLVHSQLKKHQCPFCHKTYRQLSTLTTHKRTIHGVISADDGTEIILEQMIGVGEDGSKNFNNITSKLLNLKRERNTLVTVEEESTPLYIVSSLNDVYDDDMEVSLTD